MVITWPVAQHIYLSPHADDVALSCGGMIYRQVGFGETVAVITVFAGSPVETHPLSSFARSLHDRWRASAPPGLDFSDPPAVRRVEDTHAFAALSPTIQVVHWPLPDCIYRHDPSTGQALYASEEAIFGAVQPTDPALSVLRGAPALPPGATLYVPLGAGRHVDHQLVRGAVEDWEVSTERVRYYEDYPYAAQPGAIEAAIGVQAQWEPITVILDEAALAAKVRVVTEYVSQVSTFWESVATMEHALRSHAEQVGGERLWFRSSYGIESGNCT